MCVRVCARQIMRQKKKRPRDQSTVQIWNVEGLLVSRLEYANAKRCFFITWAKGQISASEMAPDDEYHLTVVEEEEQLLTGP